MAYDDVDTDDKIIEEFDELVIMCFMVMDACANLFNFLNYIELENNGSQHWRPWNNPRYSKWFNGHKKISLNFLI